jgi:hypothetical protein
VARREGVHRDEPHGRAERASHASLRLFTAHARVQGASASIAFNGTGIALLSTQDVGQAGAPICSAARCAVLMRALQNAYAVSLDGTVARSNSSTSSGDQLFAQSGLARGTHQVVLMDEGSTPALSLSSAMLTLGDGNSLCVLLQ